MNTREKTLAIVIAVIAFGWAMMSWVIDPALAAFDELGQESEQLEQELSRARAIVDNEQKILRRWAGYRKAGLSRSRDEADAETSRALYAWAEEAGFDPRTGINLTNDKPKVDEDKPFAELSYTMNAQGTFAQVYEMLWSIRQSPFPLRLEKCVIDLRNEENEQMQLTLIVTTLFTPDEETQ